MSRQEEVEKLLKDSGDMWSLDDILDMISDGRMQSFSVGESWVVTQVNVYPRRKILDIILAIGNYDEVVRLQEQVEVFAQQHGCATIRGIGRVGWSRKRTQGWEIQGSVYTRSL